MNYTSAEFWHLRCLKIKSNIAFKIILCWHEPLMLRTVIRAALFTGNPSSQNSHLVVIYIALLAYETLRVGLWEIQIGGHEIVKVWMWSCSTVQS